MASLLSDIVKMINRKAFGTYCSTCVVTQNMELVKMSETEDQTTKMCF